MISSRLFVENNRVTIVLDGVSKEEIEQIQKAFSVSAVQSITNLLPAEKKEETPPIPETKPVVERKVNPEFIIRSKELLKNKEEMNKIGIDKTIRRLATATGEEVTDWLRCATNDEKVAKFIELRDIIRQIEL